MQTLPTLVYIGALTIVPLALMATTSFVKISVVFAILKNALGAGEVPGALVITALAAILSLYVMGPVFNDIAESTASARAELDPQQASVEFEAWNEVIEAGWPPLRDFLHRNADERERELFVDLAREAHETEYEESDALVLLPAFMVTELKEAFEIGFLVFLPFLIVELVVANVLTSLGMQSMNPTHVSMPFKLLLFVLVDGWYLLSRALVVGYT